MKTLALPQPAADLWAAARDVVHRIAPHSEYDHAPRSMSTLRTLRPEPEKGTIRAWVRARRGRGSHGGRHGRTRGCMPAGPPGSSLRSWGDELSQVGQTCRDWSGGVSAIVGESLASADEGIGTGWRGGSAADAAIRSAESGRR